MKTIDEEAGEQAKQCANFWYDKDANPLEWVAKAKPFSYGFKAGAEFAQRWIPVSEPPEDNSIVLVKSESPFKYSTAWYTNGKFKCDFIGISHERVTHWRPINMK